MTLREGIERNIQNHFGLKRERHIDVKEKLIMDLFKGMLP